MMRHYQWILLIYGFICCAILPAKEDKPDQGYVDRPGSIPGLDLDPSAQPAVSFFWAGTIIDRAKPATAFWFVLSPMTNCTGNRINLEGNREFITCMDGK